MFTAASFAVAKRGEQPKFPSADACISTLWPIPTVEYYSAIKSNEALTQAVVRTNLENRQTAINKPDTKGRVSYDSTNEERPEWVNLQKQKADGRSRGARDRGWKDAGGCAGPSGVMRSVWNKMEVAIAQLSDCTKATASYP